MDLNHPAEHDGVAFEDLPYDWKCPRCRTNNIFFMYFKTASLKPFFIFKGSSPENIFFQF